MNNQDDRDTLLPCPFCGCELKPQAINGEFSHYIHPYGKCILASTLVFKENISLWNCRQHDMQMAIEAVESCRDEYITYSPVVERFKLEAMYTAIEAIRERFSKDQ